MTHATVLIVEDEAIVAADLAGKLGQLGYEVVGIAAQGEEAVALACARRPQVVLMDIWLKGPMDGIAAAEAIHCRHDVPVIYLTAHSDAATLARAKLTEPFGYILKPFEERELATHIEMALYKHGVDRQLREQREWLRVTLRSIGDAVIASDAAGRIRFLNPAAEAITGWKTEEALGQPIQSVFHMVNEETGQPLEDPVARVLRECRAVELGNHAALVTKDGRTVPIEDSAAPILDAAERVIGAVLVFHDVTQKRRAERALREAKAAAEAANEAKSRLLANVSHELRTPMNAILGMIDLALPKQADPMARDFLQTAKGSADLLVALLDDLLDCAKIESGKLELESAPFSLRRIMDQTSQVLSVRASEKGVAFSRQIAPDVPDALVGDQVRLRQIVLNLAGNGIKFTERGEVKVDVRVDEEGESGRVGERETRRRGDAETRREEDIEGRVGVTLSFAVKDTGIGIPRSDLERIFRPFAQADPSTTRRFGGTGLGLTISSRLVETMGGRIWVESEPGQGSTFHFTARFPLANEVPAERQAPHVLPMMPSPLRILLVEDNHANQKLAAYMLRERGHLVDIAVDGHEGIRRAEGDDYDVILMDVQMPGMDGLEATRAIREREQGERRVPIIAMTAHAVKGDRERCLAAGMDEYLSKPIAAQQMIALVERLAAGGVPAAASPSAPEAAGGTPRVFDGRGLDPSAEQPRPSPSLRACHPEAGPPRAVVFDAESALRRCLSRHEVLGEIIECFFNDLEKVLPQIRAALEKGDLAEMGHMGHRLKGTVVNLCSEAARQAAFRVEQFMRVPGQRADAEQAVTELERECETLKAALVEYQSEACPRNAS